MNLFASILTSILIVTGVWFAIIYQPAPVNAKMITVSTTDVVARAMVEEESPMANVKAVSAQQSKNISSKNDGNNAPVDSISGVEQEMLISNIGKLWAEFTQQNMLHKKLTNYPTATYVLYRNISKDFTRANITIGYDSRELQGHLKEVILPRGAYKIVIADSSLTSNQLESAWKKLDFSQNILAVVERHQLNKRGDVIGVSMQVLSK